MIICDEDDVTAAVLAGIEGAPDPRLRELLSALVRHLHAFARETRLTEDEFRQAARWVVALGQKTTDSHNEAVLMAGSLGLSTLVCLINNGAGGSTHANLLGPFWRLNSPRTENGGSIVRSPTPGPALFVRLCFRDREGSPVEGAEVDVWHSSPAGLYENQDPQQAEMNLRGKFTTDADGVVSFRSVLPAAYPIPMDGPVGELIRAQRRNHMRPAHLHALAAKPGFKTLVTQIYVGSDPHLETDVQFGVTEALVGDYVRHDAGTPPAPDVVAPWYTLDFTLVMEPGESRLPQPPIR